MKNANIHIWLNSGADSDDYPCEAGHIHDFETQHNHYTCVSTGVCKWCGLKYSVDSGD